MPAWLTVSTTNYPLLFSDNFDTDTSANWSLYWGAADNVADFTTNWAFNYGATAYTYNSVTNLIPPAPNSTNGTAIGTKLTVNSDANGIIAGVNLYLKNHSFSNNYALKFDMWINYPGGAGGAGASGTTQFPIFGLNHTGTEPNWGATNNTTATDGIWFAVDGEDGSTRNYRAYVGNASGLQTELIGAPSGVTLPVSNTNVFSTPPFETSGAVGKNWVAVELNQINGTLTWKINGAVIAQRANTSAFTNGTVMLGLMDIFSSIASPVADCFVLFDNVRVEDPSATPTVAPSINTHPQGLNVNPGTNVTFNVTAVGTSPFNYQWFFNGSSLSAQTNANLTLTNAQLSNVGSYSVQVSNGAGSVLSNPGVLTVTTNSTLSALPMANSQIRFSVVGATNFNYTIDISSNLFNWNSVYTGRPSFVFTDQISTNVIARYYRAHLGP